MLLLLLLRLYAANASSLCKCLRVTRRAWMLD